jgi:putative endonuclease
MGRYWVYILASKKNGVLYAGVTNNLAARVVQHRNGEGSKFAKKYWALRLVYAQPLDDVNEAIAAEKRLKKWKRAWKVELIEREKSRLERFNGRSRIGAMGAFRDDNIGRSA